MHVQKRLTRAAPIALALALLLAGCGGKEPASKANPIAPPSSVAPAVAKTASFEGPSTGISFEYPADWSVVENGNVVELASPAALNSAILIADIGYEVSLFLAGRGDLETSIEALVNKYAGILAGDSALESYSFEWDQSDASNIRATLQFKYTNSSGANHAFMDVEQIGGRVFLSVWVSPDNQNSKDEVSAVYDALNESFSAKNIDGDIGPANLSDLGFPEAPSGFYRYYNPVTGQFFVYPDSWSITSNPLDDYVTIYNDRGAIMITENWTTRFYEIYNNNGNDIAECFDFFLDECADILEEYYGEIPRYHDYQRMATKNQELIKATFNYTVSAGTGRSFAELGIRPYDGKDGIQATLCLYRMGDSYSIDMFSIIMDSTVIYYPEL